MVSSAAGLLKFPCAFPIKSIGKAGEDFETLVVDIVRRHVTELGESQVQVRKSGKGQWVAVTLVIQAESQAQIDAIYQDLGRQDRVVWAL